MTFGEKQQNPEPEVGLAWRGNMQADYLYPNGAAGDKFYKNLISLFLRCVQKRYGCNWNSQHDYYNNNNKNYIAILKNSKSTYYFSHHFKRLSSLA